MGNRTSKGHFTMTPTRRNALARNQAQAKAFSVLYGTEAPVFKPVTFVAITAWTLALYWVMLDIAQSLGAPAIESETHWAVAVATVVVALGFASDWSVRGLLSIFRRRT